MRRPPPPTPAASAMPLARHCWPPFSGVMILRASSWAGTVLSCHPAAQASVFPECCLAGTVPAGCCAASTRMTEYFLWARNRNMHHFIISSNNAVCGQHHPHWKLRGPRQREGLTGLRQRSWERIDWVFKSRSPRPTFQCVALLPCPFPLLPD